MKLLIKVSFFSLFLALFFLLFFSYFRHPFFLVAFGVFVIILFSQLCKMWLWYRQFDDISQTTNKNSLFLSAVKQSDDLRRLSKRFKNLEEDLEMSDQDSQNKSLNFKAFLENISVGIFVVSKTKHLLLKSHSLKFYFPQLKNNHFKTLADLQRSDITVLVNRAFEDGVTVKKELFGINDHDLILEVTVVPIKDSKGDFEDVLVFLHDLTPIRAYEQQNMEFVANASHELRTPVTSIKGFAETLIDLPEEDQALREEFLEIIHKESLRLEHIVNHMLTLSKLGQNKPQLYSFDLVSFIKEITQTLRSQMTNKKLEFQLELPSKLIYETDRYMLSQIIINLLTNAIRYTEEYGKIKVSLLEKENQIDIQVSDTGIGIDQYQLERIFERFYRVNKGRSRQTGGTGLGLSIVKELSEALGGNIRVSSRVGQGSQFTLSLPISIGLGR